MRTIRIKGKMYTYNTTPENCPLCYHDIVPIILTYNVIEKEAHVGDTLQIIFRCPQKRCQKAFIGTYWQNRNRQMRFSDDFILRNTAPYSDKEGKNKISKEIEKISPNFSAVYDQAYNAEHFGLNQVAGAGYRNALEFLIKDYCILRNANKKNEINKKKLRHCIFDHIDDIPFRLKSLKTLVLKDDESHTRKWEETEIDELKNYIDETMSWIGSNLSNRELYTQQ